MLLRLIYHILKKQTLSRKFCFKIVHGFLMRNMQLKWGQYSKLHSKLGRWETLTILNTVGVHMRHTMSYVFET